MSFRIGASALLAVDQNRTTIIERIVNEWGAPLAASSANLSPQQLRTMLSGLRADHLLAASLAGSLNGLRDVMANALTSTAEVKPGLMHAKSLGDTGDDLVYTPIVPCRILDTRNGTTPPYNAQMMGGSAFPVAANLANFAPQGGSATNCTLPPGAGAFAAIAVTLTVLNPNFDAFLAASSSSDFAILTRSVVMDFSANRGLANTAIVPVDGTVKFYLGLPAQVTTHVIADAVGYLRRPTNYDGTHTITGFDATDSGGFNNTASGNYSTVSGGDLSIASGPARTVGGGGVNTASNDYSTVGGGNHNTSSGTLSTVAGGQLNVASASASTVAGGDSNLASGGYSTVSGGASNTAGASYSSVGGGQFNSAGGANSTIAGGQHNFTSGDSAFIAGGASNTADGIASFAGGTFAKAFQTGEFTWGDQTQQVFNPGDSTHNQNGLWWATASNTFNARASGGVMFVTGVDGNGYPLTGVTVGPGSGTWASHSDRNVKENFARVDARSILEKVARLSITSWNYIAEGAQVRHLGPVSQDFRAAFGLGANEHTIAVVDADGVALAAIQGLHQLLEEKDAKLNAQGREIARLKAIVAEVDVLKRKLDSIEMRLGAR